MPRIKKVEYPLAVDVLGDLKATPDERIELNRLATKHRYRSLLEVVFMLRKNGFSKDKILALTETETRLLRRMFMILDCSEFLKGQIEFAVKKRAQETKDEVYDATGEQEIEESNEDVQARITQKLEDAILLLLDNITEDKVLDADLDEVAKTLSVAFDKWRTITGKSNFNVVGVNAVVSVEAAKNDQKQIDDLVKKIAKVGESIRALEEVKPDENGSKTQETTGGTAAETPGETRFVADKDPF